MFGPTGESTSPELGQRPRRGSGTLSYQSDSLLRYLVPIAGSLMAAAGITIIELWRCFKSRERQAATSRDGRRRVEPS